MLATYTIPADNRDAVEKKLAQMNRKAAKLGTAPIAVTFAHSHIESWTVEKVPNCPEYGVREYSREWLTATVTGETASLNGWYFRATLHHTTDGNIIASVPGFEVPRHYRNAPSSCDHCATLRRRSATYLVESKDGIKQVGRSCLADFLGMNDPHKMAQWAEALGAFDAWFRLNEESDRAPRRAETIGLQTFLRAAASVIRHDGWVSRKKAQETEHTATASTAWSLTGGSFGTPEMDREMQARYLDGEGDEKGDYSAADKQLAEDVCRWILTLDEEAEGTNDYLFNLIVIGRSGLVSHRTTGLAASMISAYKRATQKQEEREKAPESPSRHVGTIGERLRDVPVTLVGIADLPPTEWGTRQLIKLADDAGNLFVWFTGATGGCWDFGGEVREPVAGDRMWVTGTVKRHGEFNGIQQTELSRCALASVAPAPKKAKKVKA